MAVVYSDYVKDKIGWFFGLTGWQLATLAVASLPVFIAINNTNWPLVGSLAAGWVLLALLVVVPVRGRSATGWLIATFKYTLGAAAGWTRFRSRAAQGATNDLNHPDLPGVLAGVVVHDGPPAGPNQARVAIIQNKASRTWAVTAAITHPGIGMADADTRRRQGQGLSDLLDVCARTELVDELLLIVRTVPDDGAERDLWIRAHRRPTSPELATQINDDLAVMLARASVRTEAFVTIVVPETRIARPAKESGGGLDGRARVLYTLMGEVEAQLRGGLAATEVAWLTSPELALAVRTGFAPGDRAGIIQAQAEHETHPETNPNIPWAQAGPSGAEPAIRHYTHDAWNSISATIKLPDKGAALGALAPVLVPSEPGERRSVLVAFPILGQAAAQRNTANSEWAADMGASLRAKAGIKTRARQRSDAAKTYHLDDKLARGHAMVRPYAVATVTVANHARINEYGRKLDAAIRRAGFAPLRLDLAQDTAMTATTIPLGASLTRRSNQ
ncbi:MAG: PrgI family protein [Acidobacteriota bacterium]|nr:PrgI family protein [Acidobacteriota bacterium]